MWGSAGDRDGSLGRQMVTQTSMEATSRWACYSRSPGTRLALTGLRRCDTVGHSLPPSRCSGALSTTGVLRAGSLWLSVTTQLHHRAHRPSHRSAQCVAPVQRRRVGQADGRTVAVSFPPSLAWERRSATLRGVGEARGSGQWLCQYGTAPGHTGAVRGGRRRAGRSGFDTRSLGVG